MSAGNNSSALRQSNRKQTLTPRARQFVNERSADRSLFPSVGDDINVKWKLEDRSVWWPATVNSISRSGRNQRVGGIVYHKFEGYDASEASVLFSNSSQQRLVGTIEGGSKEPSESSSWLFIDESCSDEEGKSDSASSGRCIRSSGEKKRSSAIMSIQKRPIQRPRSKRSPASAVVKVATFLKTEDEFPSERVNQSRRISSEGSMDLSLRLQLLERRVQDITPNMSSDISSSAASVIVSLRWALLRALEKPLRAAPHPSLDKYGVAPQELTVTAQCDNHTFRELAAALAKEHRFASANPGKSRVAFSPAFDTTQSGSSASNNMNILFSCLADLTGFLRVRDDADFDRILSKEVISDTTTVLRILGTFNVDDSGRGNNREESEEKVGTNSISASSESLSVLRIFIGSAPVKYDKEAGRLGAKSPREEGDCEEGNMQSFQTTLFQQECRYFCPLQKNFRTPWLFKNVKSSMAVNCYFDLDGTVDKEQLKNYFVLNWTRQVAPSTVKWTRDVHDVRNNSPGCLRLSIPVILITSNRNVRSLVSKLDNHIETFMKVRSRIHSLSSFK